MVVNKTKKGTSKAARSETRRSEAELRVDIFWEFVMETKKKTESDRIVDIRNGLSILLPAALRDALKINYSFVARLLNTSISTLERRMKGSAPLDCVASERLDRIARITSTVENILVSREETSQWLVREHPALDQQASISLCDTEIGARQVMRILGAMEWGGSV